MDPIRLGFSPGIIVGLSRRPFEPRNHVGAVRDVSFEVATGEILVVMGLSGSGKSTLVPLPLPSRRSYGGSIFFDGEDITRAGMRKLTELRRRKIGMVFQNFGLLPTPQRCEKTSAFAELQGLPKTERNAKQPNCCGGRIGRAESYFPMSCPAASSSA
jgi:glycine betaine/proline transport system ATP-binding protein